MREKICFVFGAGEYYGTPPAPEGGDLVIAADGGYKYLAAHGVPVHLLIGDFDSLEVIPEGIQTIRLSPVKDYTDMAEALQEGWERGYRLFYIYGGTGGRLDHTIANIQCLADIAERGGRGFLFDKETVITAVHNDTIYFPAGAEGTLSVFSHSDTAAGVYERGLKYSLTDALLQNTCTIGLSNEFTGAQASVKVKSGTLIVMWTGGVDEVES